MAPILYINLCSASILFSCLEARFLFTLKIKPQGPGLSYTFVEAFNRPEPSERGLPLKDVLDGDVTLAQSSFNWNLIFHRQKLAFGNQEIQFSEISAEVLSFSSTFSFTPWFCQLFPSSAHALYSVYLSKKINMGCAYSKISKFCFGQWLFFLILLFVCFLNTFCSLYAFLWVILVLLTGKGRSFQGSDESMMGDGERRQIFFFLYYVILMFYNIIPPRCIEFFWIDNDKWVAKSNEIFKNTVTIIIISEEIKFTPMFQNIQI